MEFLTITEDTMKGARSTGGAVDSLVILELNQMCIISLKNVHTAGSLSFTFFWGPVKPKTTTAPTSIYYKPNKSAEMNNATLSMTSLI